MKSKVLRYPLALLLPALAIVAARLYEHFEPVLLVSASALVALAIAARDDVDTYEIPTWILLLALALAAAAAAVGHRIPWLALAVTPLALVAWRSKERAFGWADVLAILIILIALPFAQAIAGIIIGAAISFALTRVQRTASGPMLPYLVFGAAIGTWLPF